MKLLKIIPVLFISLITMSCEDVIELDLDTAPPKLVIDASIDWVKNTSGNEQKIKLTTTTSYYATEFPTVSGAVIYVTNSENTVFNFIESSSPGEYICTDFLPEIGETYTLTITVNDITYTATETLMGTPSINENITQNENGGFTGDELEVRFSYQDDATQENYYMTRIKSNRVAFPEYWIESDELTQGNQIEQFYAHEDLEIGDSLNIRLYGISRRYYDYFRKVLNAAGSDGGPFAPAAVTVRGNIINQNDNDNFPLGYFRLSEVSERNYTIQEF